MNYARANNLQVRQSQLNNGLNQIELNQLKFERLPSINAGGSYNYNTGSFQDPVTFNLVTQDAQTGSFQLSACVPLL